MSLLSYLCTTKRERFMLITSLLYRFGIRHVVVCPGSRNAPLADAFARCSDTYTVHPVTDERSAGFVAIGLSEITDKPVAVCVTSGTAVANVYPAVVEAYHRNIPLVVISADRPKEWIDQMDGQTMTQPGAYGKYAEYCDILPRVEEDEEREWYNNREMNRVLGYVINSNKPGHINIQLREPLFDFESDSELIYEGERTVRQAPPKCAPLEKEALQEWADAKRRMVIVGQGYYDLAQELTKRKNKRETVVLAESLSNLPRRCVTGEKYDIDPTEEAIAPDMVVYLGGHIISKKLKQWLRQQNIKNVWRIDHWASREMPDTFMKLTRRILVDKAEEFFALLPYAGEGQESEADYYASWENRRYNYPHKNQQEIADKLMKAIRRTDALVLANSSSVRYAQKSEFHDAGKTRLTTCNRGVNGIEGTISQAVGIALGSENGRVVCITGDLSFFYDHNALWNTHLPKNLRIMLINDYGGEIFKGLKGLGKSPVSDTYIGGKHRTSGEGWCKDCGVKYMNVSISDATKGVRWLMNQETDETRLLEVTIWV